MAAIEQLKGFSIIICSYNGANKIKEAVKYLKCLEVNGFDFEIIIVDNNSTDDTYVTAQALSVEHSEIKILVVKEQKSGKPNAMFTGFNMASYKYLLVCDDDNWLYENYLTVAFQLLDQNDRIGILGGRGVIEAKQELPVWFPLLENAWAIGRQALMSGEVLGRPSAVWGAGMVIRKDAWNALLSKGLTTFLTGRKMKSLAMAGEDTELCILVKALGYKIYFEESMIYLHDIPNERLTWKNLLNLWEGFSRSQVYFNLYETIFFDLDLNQKDYRLLWRKEVKKNLLDFLYGATTVNYYKSLYIAFIENREGYLPGLEKRKYLTRVNELLRIKKKYADHYKDVCQLKKSVNERDF